MTLALVWARARTAAALVAATSMVAVLTATLAALGPTVSEAVTDASLRATLERTPAPAAGVAVGARGRAADLARLDRQVAGALAEDRERFAAASLTLGVTDSYDLADPMQAAIEAPTFRLAALVPSRPLLDVVDGRAATAGAQPPEAILHREAAGVLGVGPGDRIELRRGGAVSTVTISGLFEPLDRADPLWWDDPTIRDGIVPGQAFTEVGPLLLEPADLMALDRAARFEWRMLPDPDRVDQDDLDHLGQLPAALASALAGGGVDGADVSSELPEVIDTARPALATTTSAVLVIILQLVAVSLPAVSVAAGALVNAREAETSLLRSRGAAPRQVVAAAGLEAAAIVALAVAVAPFLALVAVELVERIEPVASSGLDLRPAASGLAVLAAGAGGALVFGCLVAPSIRAAGSFTETRRRRARALDVALFERLGLDVALVVVAVLGLIQLRSRRSPLGETLRGQLDVDPLLVVAPALGLLAAGLLALRLVRVAGRSAALAAARGRGLPAVFAAWQLARRPARTRRMVLLLVLAVAVATFATTFGSSWHRAVGEQADAAVGADQVAVLPTTTRTGVSPVAATSVVREVEGVEGVVPAERLTARVGGDHRPVTLLLADGEQLASTLRGVERLVGEAPDFAALAAGRFELGGVALPDGDSIELSVSLEAAGAVPAPALRLSAIVVDGDGQPRRTPPVVVEPGGGQRLEVSLAGAPGGLGPDGRRSADGRAEPEPSGPLQLVGWELSIPTPQRSGSGAVPWPMLEISLSDATAGGEPVPFDDGWVAQLDGPAAVDAGEIMTTPRAGNRGDTGAGEPPGSNGSSNGVSLRVSTGTNRTGAPVTTSLLAPRLLEPAPSERIPVLLGSPVAARTSLAVGDPVTVTAEATPIDGVVAGIVPSLPSLTDGELVVADRPAVAARRLLDGRTVRAPTELLVSVAPGQRVEVAEILRAEPLDADVTDRREEALAAANDPVTVAVLGSLTFGALAAALVAAMGLLAGATADAWDRAGELAVLRALGMPLAGVRRILAGEAVLVVVVAVALGMTTGIVLGRIAVPALAIGRDGRPAVPEPAVVVPVVALALVAAVAGVIVAAMPLVAAAVQRRQRPAELLRMGDGA